MRLSTDKVRLIPYESSHWPFLYSWSNSGEYGYFFGNMAPLTSQSAATFNQSGVTFMIVSAQNIEEIFGVVAISNIQERHRNVHYNILLDKKFQGLELAREATKLAIYYVMNCLNMFKVIATIADENEPSKKATEEFGFEFEAKLKQEIYIDGEFRDVLRYKITKGAFNKKFKAEMDGLGG